MTGTTALLGGGVAASTGVARAAEARNVPFAPVPPPHLVQAEQMVQYQRMLAEGQLTTGLAGHWPLTATTEDRSGNGRALTRGSATATGWSDLRVGQELTLNGAADAAYAATSSVLDTTRPFTVSAWVRPAALTGIMTAVSQDGAQTSRFLLMQDRDPDTGQTTWSFRVRTADQAQASKVAAVATTKPVAGTWVHLTGVWTGTEVRIYVNGAKEGTAADATTPWASGQGFNVGRAKWNGNAVNEWNGQLSDVRAYDRALSDQEIDLISGQAAVRSNVYLVGEEAQVVFGQPADPATWVNRSRCNSFVTAVLRHTYPWAADNSYFATWFGATDPRFSPTAARYQSRFSGENGGAGPRFKAITRVTDLRPGDLVSVNYNGTVANNTGHIVMVRTLKGVRTGFMDQPGLTQYVVEVVDCTASPHGVFGLSTYWDCPDTRMVDNLDKAVSQNRQGAGIGHMVFYAKADGSFAGHRWSVNSADFRAVAETTGTGPDATTSSGDSITAARVV
ncbi:LamG domain-containing protein [Kitasatospora albolonga]|uniref:LamG domain-containing protein n=1 Tax=Kitasatospora albolonga TaxID=68173 RepID=UPI0031F1552D